MVSVILGALLLLLPLSAAAQSCTLTQGQICKVHDYSATPFTSTLRRFPALDVLVRITAPALIRLDFNAHIKHTYQVDRVIGYGVRAGVRGPVDDPSGFTSDVFKPWPEWIQGSVGGGNIMGPQPPYGDRQNYGQAVFAGLHALTVPGWYRVEIWGNAYTTACEGCNSLATMAYDSNPLNQLIVSVQ